MRKTAFLTIAFLLVVVTALGLVACKRYEPVPDVKITIDEDAVYTLDAISDNIEGLDIELVTDGKAEKVDYHVISSKVSDDGNYIEVEVSVAGEVRTVRLPYAGDNASLIREELRPLYALLNKDGDKCFAVTISGDGLLPETKEHRGFGVKAILNVDEEAGTRFAVLSGTPNAQFAVTEYDNVVISLGDLGIEKSLIEKYLTTLIDQIDFDPDTLLEEDGTAADETVTSEEQTTEEDLGTLASTFKGISTVLDFIDRVIDNGSIARLLGVTLEKEGNAYVMTAGSKKVSALLQTILPKEAVAGIEFKGIFDAIDAATDGAFAAGQIEITLTFEFKSNGAAISLGYDNKKTGVNGKISVTAEVSATPFAIPGEESKGDDVEITVPFALPAKGLDLNLTAVIHVKDLFDPKGEELATLSLDHNGVKDAVRVVLNDGYLYVDMTPLMDPDSESEKPVSFYYAFEKDGKPVGFYDALPDLLGKLFGGFGATDRDDEGFDADDDDGSDGGIPEGDPRFAHGFGCRLADDEDYVIELPIGSTERDLRAKLVVFVMDEEDNEIPYEDYTVEDFDGSASFSGSVTIVFAPGYSASVDVRVCDVDNIQMSSLAMDPKYYYPMGTTIAEAQENCTYGINMTDGTITWTVGAVGLNITQAMSTTGTILSADGSFDVAGDYMVFVEKDGKSSMFSAHVYDPENVVVESFDCDGSIEVWQNDTEADIRERLYVTISYDDGETEEVEDYEIVGFDVKGDSFEIKYAGYEKLVAIHLVDGDEEAEEEGSSLTDYLRFVTPTDDGTVDGEKALVAAKKLLTDNAELIRSIYDVTWTSGRGITLKLAINDASDKDLLAVANLFMGIPTEDGWTDFDAENLTELLNGLLDGYGMLDLKTIVKRVFGAELEDILSDLSLTAELGWKGGISFTLSLGNNAEGERAAEYLRVGCSVRTITAGSSGITVADVEKAKGIEELPEVALAAVLKIFMA